MDDSGRRCGWLYRLKYWCNREIGRPLMKTKGTQAAGCFQFGINVSCSTHTQSEGVRSSKESSQIQAECPLEPSSRRSQVLLALLLDMLKCQNPHTHMQKNLKVFFFVRIKKNHSCLGIKVFYTAVTSDCICVRNTQLLQTKENKKSIVYDFW